MAPRPLDSRALAALAANPGCRRRALLDGAGVDKGALAEALGSPAPFGQSQFAFARGHQFEARAKADDGAELIRLLCARTGETPPEPADVTQPDLTANGPAGRAARTRAALAEATAAGGWALLDHPMLTLEVAGSTAYLEPDALAVSPSGVWTVVEIKSFPVLDGSADPAKVGAAARQAAVYALALEEPAEESAASVHRCALLVCPKDFSNLPTADTVDIRKQRAATRRQLARLTRVEEIAASVPEGLSFSPELPQAELTAAVASVPAAYAPECLATCELAFHCRERARAEGAVEVLGRSVRGELGGLTTVDEVLAAAHEPAAHRRPSAEEPPAARRHPAVDGESSHPTPSQPAQQPHPRPAGEPLPTAVATGEEPRPTVSTADAAAAAALRRAARLRAEALGQRPLATPESGQVGAPAHDADSPVSPIPATPGAPAAPAAPEGADAAGASAEGERPCR